MPLVGERDLLLPAFRSHQAVGAFNANNMEMVQAYIWAAEEMTKELGKPQDIIIQVSPGAAKYADWEMAAGMVKIAAKHTNIRIALNLDHGTSLEEIQRALDNDFTAVLYDGSALELEKNICITRKVVEMCHRQGVPVEAELGKIPKIEDYFTAKEIAQLRALTPAEAVSIIREKAASSVEELMAKPEDVVHFVTETGCDFLAAAFGSIHGIWDDILPIRLDRLREIQELTHIPLVCHGSSGVLMSHLDAERKGIDLLPGEGTLLDAIQTGGVTKVNVATSLSVAFIDGFHNAYLSNPSEKDYRKLGGPARESVKEKVKEYLRLFAGQVNNGWIYDPT